MALHLTEPVSMVTDYALAAASTGFAVGVARSIGPRTRVSAWFWCAAFIASGVAAAAGGTFHGFALHLDGGTLTALWNLTVFSMGACGAFVTAAIHASCVRRGDGTVMWLALAVATTLLGAAVQQQWVLRTTRLGHNDAYHVIQIAGLYFLFRCARTTCDRPGLQSAALDRRTEPAPVDES